MCMQKIYEENLLKPKSLSKNQGIGIRKNKSDIMDTQTQDNQTKTKIAKNK